MVRPPFADLINLGPPAVLHNWPQSPAAMENRMNGKDDSSAAKWFLVPTWMIAIGAAGLMLLGGVIIFIEVCNAIRWKPYGHANILLSSSLLLSGVSVFVALIIEKRFLAKFYVAKQKGRRGSISNCLIHLILILGSFSFIYLMDIQHNIQHKYHVRKEKKYCDEIVSGKIPLPMILSKEVITSDELRCLSLAIVQQKEIDQNNLEEMLKLDLPIYGLANILRHKNSMDKTKERVLHKILLSDRNNFERYNPLAGKEGLDIRSTVYHPFVTGKRLHDNALLLDSNPEWYNDKECINLLYNLVKTQITTPNTLDFIVKKINAVLSMYVDGMDSAFMKQNCVSCLLEDIYLHKNISKDTRNKMLNFYKGNDDTKAKRKLISTLRGIIINNAIRSSRTQNDEIVELIGFVLEKDKNRISYFTEAEYCYDAGYSGIDYRKLIERNILSVATLVELAKQKPRSLRYSLPKIINKYDLSGIKNSLEKGIKDLEMKADDLSGSAELSVERKNKLYSINKTIELYSELLNEVATKIDTISNISIIEK